MRKRVAIAGVLVLAGLLAAVLVARARGSREDRPKTSPEPSAARSAPPPEAGEAGFQGVVTGADGKPAAGARVLLFPDAMTAQGPSPCAGGPLLETPCAGQRQAILEALESGGLAPEPLGETSADAAGHYRLPARAGVRHVLLAVRGKEVGASEELAAPAEVPLRLFAAGPAALRVVSSADRAPIAGARVAVVQKRPTATWRATTGPGGEAALDAALSSALVLVVTAEGFGPEVKPLAPGDLVGEEGELMEVALDPLSTIAGRVLDGTAPAAAATVSSPKIERTATSDAEGRFRLERVPVHEGMVVEAVLGERAGIARLEGVEQASDLEIFLQRSARLSLRFAGAAPGERIRVGLDSLDGASRRLAAPPYLFERLPPGKYRLAARAQRRHSVELWLDLAAGESAEREIVLEEIAGLSGTVVDEQGAPVAEAGLDLSRIVREQGADGEPETEPAGGAESDERGAFEMADLAPGSYVAKFQAQGFLGTQQRVAVPAAELRVVLRRGARIEGRVEDERGRGIAGAVVSAAPAQLVEEQLLGLETKLYVLACEGKPADEAIAAQIAELEAARKVERADPADGSAIADATGAFVVSGLEERAYDVEARAPDRTVARTRAHAPAAGLRLVLQAGGALSVKAVDEAGAPVPQAELWGRRMGEPPEGAREFRPGARAGAATRFENLAPGRYELMAKADGFVERAATVSLASGERREVSLKLETARPLQGVVVDEAGVGQAKVDVFGHLEGSEREACAGSTDGQGRFTCEPFSAASAIELRALARRDGRAFEARAALPAGARTARLTLRPRARRSVRLLAPDGEPASGCEASLTPAAPAKPRCSAADASSDRLFLQTQRQIQETFARLLARPLPIEISGGTCTYESQPESRALLRAVCAEGWVAAEVDLGAPDSELPLSPGASLVVRLPTSGTFRVDLSQEGGASLHRTEARRAVSFTGLPPGTWNVVAVSAAGERLVAQVALEAGGTAETSVRAEGR